MIFLFFSFAIFLLSALFSIIWIVDSLRLYHKPYFCKNEVFKNIRFSAAGIIKNYEFDSVILGTSMLENTSSKEASYFLNSKFMNLSTPASDFYERFLILNHTFKYKRLKKIIYSLDTDKMINISMGSSNYLEQFKFLYDDNKFNDIRAYLNDRMIKKTFKQLVGRCKSNDIDRPAATLNDPDENIGFGGFENWDKITIKNQMEGFLKINDKNKQTKFDNDKFLKQKEYINEYLLNFVKNNQNTEFIFVVPPYSRLKDALEIKYRYDNFLFIKEVLRYLVEQSQIYKNLKIYAWGDTDYPDNIANYKDLTHYSHEFNSQMLEYLRDGIGLLTPQNFDEYYTKFEQKSREFDLMPYYEKIKDLTE